MSPDLDLDTLRVERAPSRSSISMAVGRRRIDGAAHRLAPPGHVGQHGPADDAPPGPVVDAVFGVGDAVVVAVDGVPHVAEAVPLARALRVPPHELVIVTDGEIVDHVFEGPIGRTAAGPEAPSRG